MKKLFFCWLMLLSLTACQEDEEALLESPDYLVFGHYYGFCGGENCVEIFKIENGTLFEDTKDQYPGGKPYEGNYEPKSAALYEKVKDLPHQVPARLLSEDRSIIGSPDAADGGGIYLEIGRNGMKRYFFIDKTRHNVPDYLYPFLDKVEAAIAELK
ncbi:hypothetical protein [Rufibacter latericius]|uniref:Uncharacterized protein n=1 Tax=Rufibacter latericius TaxID=2487040 RepID=A0A3M9N1P4_9BACT|nr:hypothetical protein [Rufibacter latericius]RNI31257.1 hypothetical protein EFB08_01630 [Rufibacter latericius]